MRTRLLFPSDSRCVLSGNIHDPDLRPGTTRAIVAADRVGDFVPVGRELNVVDGAKSGEIAALESFRIQRRAYGGAESEKDWQKSKF